MRVLLFFVLLISQTVWAQDFCPIPNLSHLGYEPQLDMPELFDPVTITKVDLKRNSETASFCRRPLEMMDTIIFHHSEDGSSTKSAIELNDYHLLRKTDGEDWYMLAYNYVVNTPYASEEPYNPIVTEGRPLEIVGAHTLSLPVVPMTEEQKTFWNEGKILCGKEKDKPKLKPDLVSGGKIRPNVTSIGVVIVGNYSPYSKRNLTGYKKNENRQLTLESQWFIAKFACQLQKQYPRVKNISYHNNFTSTLCPGNIKNYIGKIKTLAQEYGCKFN